MRCIKIMFTRDWQTQNRIEIERLIERLYRGTNVIWENDNCVNFKTLAIEYSTEIAEQFNDVGFPVKELSVTTEDVDTNITLTRQ